MQELVKGFIYPHGQVSANGKQFNKYIVGMVLLTTEAIDDISGEGEFVVMGVNSPFRQQIGNITDQQLRFCIFNGKNTVPGVLM